MFQYIYCYVLNDPCAADADKLLAGLNIALAVVFELLEPDDLLPVGLPVDDIGRKAVVRAAREGVTEAGVEGFEKAVRKTAGDDVADRAFREMGLDDLVGAVCSFSPETPVTTELGLLPIGSLWQGLEVWAYNEATGEFDCYPITAVWSHLDETIVYVTIDGEVIETTPEHPFHTAEGEWVAAGDLRVGDKIRRADGSYGLVAGIVVVEQPQWMYNLTVAEAQTYFVGAGRWLVHNACRPKTFGTLPKSGKWVDIDKIEAIHAPDSLIVHEGKTINRVDYYIEKISKGGYNLQTPITVVESPSGRIIQSDGHHRLEALRRLGYTQAPVIVDESLNPKMFEMLADGWRNSPLNPLNRK